MDMGWTWETVASNVVEERLEQLLCTNRAAQWPVRAMQLTAPLCCMEATEKIRSLLYMQTTLVFVERHFSGGPRQFAAQLDSFCRMELNHQASAFNTKSINHLWQPSVHTLSGLIGEDFSLFPIKQQLNQTQTVFFTLTERQNTCMMWWTRDHVH